MRHSSLRNLSTNAFPTRVSMRLRDLCGEPGVRGPAEQQRFLDHDAPFPIGRPKSLSEVGGRCPGPVAFPRARSCPGRTRAECRWPETAGRAHRVLSGHEPPFRTRRSVLARRRPAGGDRGAGGRRRRGDRAQTLLGVTGSGKTMAMAASSSWSRSRPWSSATTRRWPPSCAPSSATSFRTTPSSISSRTSTTTSPRRTSPTRTRTSRKTRRSTTRSSACATPRPSRC